MENESHVINILNRQDINIDGVKKVVSFDDEEFLLDTVLGPLKVSGSKLEIVKLDTYQKKISIKGVINELIYLKGEKKEPGLLSKLFK